MGSRNAIAPRFASPKPEPNSDQKLEKAGAFDVSLHAWKVDDEFMKMAKKKKIPSIPAKLKPFLEHSHTCCSPRAKIFFFSGLVGARDSKNR